MNKKQQIIKELEKKEFPNLKFLYDEKSLDYAEEILNNFLEEEKKLFKELLKTPKKNIDFDIFEKDTKLGYYWSLLNHLQAVDKGDKIDKIIENFEPKYIDFWNEVAYNKDFYDMLVYCFENCNLDEEQKRILEERIKSFKLRWINLDKKSQEKLKKLSKDLAKISQDFNSNIVKDKAKWEYLISDFEDIKNLPEATLNQAKNNASKKWLDWWLFTADPTMMWDIISYCDNKKIRKDFTQALNSFASNWEFDNRKNILEILKKKNQIAKILWYKNYAELSLETKMADSPKQVIDLIEWISKKAHKKAKKEIEELKKYFNLKQITPSDLSYYSRIYKEKEYKIDSKELRKYFEFEEVLSYLHNLVENLYWIKLKKINIETYNKNVKIYEVYKDKKLISYYLLDPFYRETKRPWAWADNLREKDYLTWEIPIIVNVCNFQFIKEKENILYLRDVETLFHEFWHALHEMLSESKYSELSGFWVEWDFVELPSQLHENWVWERESLEKLAKHYKTWKKLQKDILDRLDSLKTFMSWNFVARQNEFALLDMYLYKDLPPKNIEDLDKKTLDLTNKFWVFKRDENYKMYTSFGHIFGWGYSAGYYSYIWAEILEADVFEKIKQMWMFDRKTWEKFLKTILWQGTRKKARELFFDFMWREVSNEAFMKRKWLKKY